MVWDLNAKLPKSYLAFSFEFIIIFNFVRMTGEKIQYLAFSFYIVYNQNLKSKVGVENFHIFLTALEEGGSTQAVRLTAFSLFLFYDFPISK